MYGFDKEFPNLGQDNHTITSPQTEEYNCIAWAANDSEQFWWPCSKPVAFWPEGVLDELSVPAFAAAFGTLGYVPCADGAFEDGVEKVVLYVDQNNIPTHMSRQLENGSWTSKLGRWCDISHDHVSVLHGPSYGTGRYFFSRPKANNPQKN